MGAPRERRRVSTDERVLGFRWFNDLMSSPRRARRGRGCLAAFVAFIALMFAAPASVFVLLGLFPGYQYRGSGWWVNKLAMLAAFIPFGWPLWVLATLFALLAVAISRGRGRVATGLISVVCVVGLIVQTSWLAPHFVGRIPQVEQPMRIVTLNVWGGRADASQILDTARDADVVVLTEANIWAVRALKEAGMEKEFRHRLTNMPDAVAGTAIYSRYPIIDEREILYSYQQRIVTLRTPAHGDVTVVAYRPRNPTQGARVWSNEGRQMAQEIAPLIGHGPLVMAGDFNAVNQHLVMQRFFDLGLQDAAVEANAGWLPTWPANRRFPPMVEIDHVLVAGGLHASSLTSFRVDGADHLGLIAEVG